MPKIKLASERLSRSGVSGGLSAGKLPLGAGRIDSSGARISAPQINPNVSNVKYSPHKIPGIQDELLATTLMSGATVAQQFNQSAFAFQERQDKVDADALVLMYRAEMRQAKLKYGELELKDATAGYDGFVNNVDDKFNSIGQNASSGVLQKAALRLGEARNITINAGATHKARQFKLVEQQNDYALAQDQEASIAVDGFAHFDTEDSQGFLANQKTQEIRDGHVKKQMTFAINDDYEKQRMSGVDPLKAINTTREKYLKYKKMLDPISAQELDQWMMTKTLEAEKAAVTARNKGRTAYKKQIQDDAPRDFYNWINNDQGDRVAGSLAGIRSQYEYDYEAEKAIVDIHKKTLDITMENSQHLSPIDRRHVLDNKINEMFKGERINAYNSGEVMAIKEYGLTTLPNKQYEQQTTNDRMNMTGLSNTIAKYREAGKALPPQPAPANMSDKQIQNWNKVQTDYNRERIEGIPLSLRNNRAGMASYFNNLLEMGPLSDEHKDQMDALLWSGQMDFGVWSKMTTDNNKMTAGGSSRQETFKTEPKYLAAMNRINTAADIGMYTGGDRRPGGKNEKYGQKQLEWDWNTDVAKTEAKAALTRAVRRNPQDFDYNTWWTEYVSANYTGGKPVARSYWADLPGFAGDVVNEPGSVFPNPVQAVKDWKSGQASVMDKPSERPPLGDNTDYLGTQYPLSPEAEAKKRGNR